MGGGGVAVVVAAAVARLPPPSAPLAGSGRNPVTLKSPASPLPPFQDATVATSTRPRAAVARSTLGVDGGRGGGGAFLLPNPFFGVEAGLDDGAGGGCGGCGAEEALWELGLGDESGACVLSRAGARPATRRGASCRGVCTYRDTRAGRIV